MDTNDLIYLKKGGVLHVPVYVLQETKEPCGFTCVVTGGARGLGECITRRLLSAGAEVIVVGRNIDKLEMLQNSIKNELLHTYQWDLTDLTNIEQQLARIADLSKSKIFQIWINNAAYVTGNGEMNANPMSTYYKTFDLNIKSLLFVGEAVCKYFKDNRINGKMINISSLSSIQADTHPYFISKRAVNAITEGLAKKIYTLRYKCEWNSTGVFAERNKFH
ncbi:MAG: SDR family NAD(P)-dependent oxidoreductase [Paludibacteraceae bacterium]|nr:SDR family NAD(P)-dependent oxidoreductase [Paludibacteraceae bacterium]